MSSAAGAGEGRRTPAPSTVRGTALRRGYLDWLRGVAVLIMIQAHLLDSWTRFPDRESVAFAWAMTVGGMGAPLFLFLAGVAVPLSAGSKWRRGVDASGAARAVVRRGLEIFGLAFLFRLQAWVLGWSSPRALLKVDILNIMGPSIMAAAALWGAARTTAARFVLFLAATIAMGFVTPIVRSLPFVMGLPDPIQAYIRPVPYLSNFVFFPWAGFVFGGALVGVVLDAVPAPDQERRANIWFAVMGLAVAAIAFTSSYFPSWHPASSFWTTSPAFFFLRLALLTLTVPAAYLWERRPGGTGKWSPLQQLGRTSLFIYWIHVEMVYGLVSRPWHKGLPWTQAWIALAIFAAFMLVCSIAKDRAVDWWKRRSLDTHRDSGIDSGGAPGR